MKAWLGSGMTCAALLCAGCGCDETDPHGRGVVSDAGTRNEPRRDAGGGRPDAGHATAPYDARDLGPGQCSAIGPGGRVAGTDASGSTFLTATDGSRTELAKPKDGRAVVTAVGASGEVVGFIESGAGRKAAEYSGGAWKELETPDGKWSMASSIDEQGIVGTTGDVGKSTVQAVRWTTGKISTLPAPSSRSSSAFLAANGRVAGIVEADGPSTHAFLLESGALEDLGTLGGTNSNPFALSADGAVVGAAEVAGGAVHAFVWKRGEGIRDLGLPAEARASEARGIDSAGRILGNVVDSTGIARAVAFGAQIADLALPPDDGASSFYSARLVAVSPDGRALGVGVVRGGDSALRCIVWGPQ